MSNWTPRILKLVGIVFLEVKDLRLWQPLNKYQTVLSPSSHIILRTPLHILPVGPERNISVLILGSNLPLLYFYGRPTPVWKQQRETHYRIHCWSVTSPVHLSQLLNCSWTEGVGPITKLHRNNDQMAALRNERRRLFETAVFCGMTPCTLVNLPAFWRICLRSEGSLDYLKDGGTNILRNVD
jgi:hypothetical protein